MATTLGLIPAIIVTAGLFVGGGWAASHLKSDNALSSAAPQKALASEQDASQPIQLAQASGPGITLTVENVKNSNGKIVVLAYDDAAAYKAYDVDKAAGYAEADAQAGSVDISLPELTAGPYALVLFHDEDGNYDFNLSAEGYPLEGYGTSGATDALDEPSFDEASTSPGNATIKMYYP